MPAELTFRRSIYRIPNPRQGTQGLLNKGTGPAIFMRKEPDHPLTISHQRRWGFNPLFGLAASPIYGGPNAGNNGYLTYQRLQTASVAAFFANPGPLNTNFEDAQEVDIEDIEDLVHTGWIQDQPLRDYDPADPRTYRDCMNEMVDYTRDRQLRR